MFEMVSAAWRIKWWNYRYVVIALLVVNIFLANHFFFDRFPTDYVDLAHIEEGGRKPPIPNEDAKDKLPLAEQGKQDSGKISTKPSKSEPSAESAKATLTSHVIVGEPSISPSHYNLHNYDFDGEYVGWPLERVCRESKAVPGLVYVCDNNSGGIGNIRNFILTCIRYGIEAGATGLIMPRIQRRSEDDVERLFSADFEPFSYFFDEAHFREAMGKHCQQMVLYNKLADLPNAAQRNEATEFYPKELIPGGPAGDGCGDQRGTNRHADQFRENHDAWLHKYSHYPNDTVPTTVRFRWATFFEWQIIRDGPEFANTFGDLLRIRSDIQELAMKTIDEMANFSLRKPEAQNATDHQKRASAAEGWGEKSSAGDAGKQNASMGAGNNTEGNSSDSWARTSVSEEAKRKPLGVQYFGVHLRTEGDALRFWPNFDFQTKGYLKKAKESGLKHAYIATGNATEGHKFGKLALEQMGMRVAGKTDLLTGMDLKLLKDLSWDQQALVDFLVLTKSAHFTGCSFSSFTMNIAMKRHTMTNGIYSRPWKSPGDEYSTLVGRFQDWFGDWMFMYECMWP